MKRILFVCSGNTCRSPMAAALFARILEDHKPEQFQEYQVSSAGIFAAEGMRAAREAVQAMYKYDINISEYKSSQLDPDMIEKSDFIFTMTRAQRDCLLDMFPDTKAQICLLGDFAGLMDEEVCDPYGKGEQMYHQCAEQLMNILKNMVHKL